MARGKVVNLDPYEIPAHLIPPGMMYQWVAKKSHGSIDPHWQTMLNAGWTIVPYERLATHYKGRYRMEDDSGVMIGGQVLMERTRDASKIARDKEMDQASINATNGRSIAIDLTPPPPPPSFEIETAKSMKLSSGQYAAWRVKMIADGKDPSIIVGSIGGKLMFADMPNMPRPRAAKYKWLSWLFDLISTDAPKDTDYE